MVLGSTNITLRNINVKPCGCDKMHMDKDLIKDKLYELIDQFNERKINRRDFYSVLLDNTQPFYDGNKRTCKIICQQFQVRFIILTRIVDESSIRNGGQKNALKKSMKSVQTCIVL